MTTLTLNPAWLEPGFSPDGLYDSPFAGVSAQPRFDDVVTCKIKPGHADTLDGFAAVGGDRRARSGSARSRSTSPDGEEEPECGDTLDLLEVPAERRYRHDMRQPDPYGLAGAECDGWAPLYFRMRFMPADAKATLVTGLGGGEWFDYPAAGWHAPRKHRVEHTDLRAMWIDTWPQYWLLPDAWADGYKAMVNPYASVAYARVANRCQPEWLVEVRGYPALDMVRKAMLDHLDGRLADLGWKPHVYDWRLGSQAADDIDSRYRRSWLGRMFHRAEWGKPSDMHHAPHACLTAGFASWCERLLASGHTIEVAEA